MFPNFKFYEKVIVNQTLKGVLLVNTKEIIKHTYQFKRSTAQRWLDLNPILRQGEPGFEYDTGKLKIGNGFTPWKDLPYIETIKQWDNF